jgi:hypothetical protein
MKEAPTKLVSDILTLMAKRMSDHDDQQFSDSELAEIVDLVVAGTRNEGRRPGGHFRRCFALYGGSSVANGTSGEVALNLHGGVPRHNATSCAGGRVPPLFKK